jgi:Rnl2 family RNA ligase
MENSYQEKWLDIIRQNGLDIGQFCVTEKIHGSNFSFITNGEEIREGKRTSVIGESESFQGCHTIVDGLRPQILELFKEVSNLNGGIDGIEQMQVFGEIFGGFYPHDDVPPDNNVGRIQKGVYYHPSIRWRAFDIRVQGKDWAAYVNADVKFTLFEQAGVPYMAPLFIGTLQECLDYPCEFESTVSALYGLPPIEGNNAEGKVITPMTERRFGQTRVILKHKGEKWTEKAKEPKKIRPPKTLGPDLVAAIEEASKYVTENRFLNVVSKEPFTEMKQFGTMMRLLLGDVMEDFSRENPGLIHKLGKSERKDLNKNISRMATPIVKEYAQKNIFEGDKE